jgi:hypothetical protein
VSLDDDEAGEAVAGPVLVSVSVSGLTGSVWEMVVSGGEVEAAERAVCLRARPGE